MAAELSVSLIGHGLPQMTPNFFGRAVIGGVLEAAADDAKGWDANKERRLMKLKTAPWSLRVDQEEHSHCSLVALVISKRRPRPKRRFPGCFAFPCYVYSKIGSVSLLGWILKWSKTPVKNSRGRKTEQKLPTNENRRKQSGRTLSGVTSSVAFQPPQKRREQERRCKAIRALAGLSAGWENAAFHHI